MFLLKGRFSWKERASKIWLKKGKLHQVSLWTKLDYCKLPVTLKYGVASVRIWLLLNDALNSVRAII
jgi:ribosomal protein S3